MSFFPVFVYLKIKMKDTNGLAEYAIFKDGDKTSDWANFEIDVAIPKRKKRKLKIPPIHINS